MRVVVFFEVVFFSYIIIRNLPTSKLWNDPRHAEITVDFGPFDLWTFNKQKATKRRARQQSYQRR